jgi:hypothetical protein
VELYLRSPNTSSWRVPVVEKIALSWRKITCPQLVVRRPYWISKGSGGSKNKDIHGI